MSNITAGAKYTVNVYSYIDNGAQKVLSDSYSSITTTALKKMKKPTVKQHSKGKVKVRWSSISGAAGYQISKGTKSSRTSITSTITGGAAKSKVIRAKKKKTYYYKVRAYTNGVNGNTIYGPWSPVKSYKGKK